MDFLEMADINPEKIKEFKSSCGRMKEEQMLIDAIKLIISTHQTKWGIIALRKILTEDEYTEFRNECLLKHTPFPPGIDHNCICDIPYSRESK